ncbi:MAG TPA: hypothetical protein PLM85_08900 [Nitrosomonas sp.]|nr:hypothetical protein [Nitrosomonas sp.]
MISTDKKFNPDLLNQMASAGNGRPEQDESTAIKSLILHYKSYIEKLKKELKVADGAKDKKRSDELTDDIAIAESEMEDVVGMLPNAEYKKNRKQKKPKAPKRELPQPNQNLQIDLFRQFITNYDNDVSNSLDLWDSIPKYFLTSAQVKLLRIENGLAMPAQWSYSDRENKSDVSYTVRIQPALLEVDGKTLACFPGATEELIEEVLKKFLLDQQLGIHDVSRQETWVKFSLNMIERELASRGKTRSKVEIRHSLEVMARSHLVWTKGGKAAYQGTIISELITVDRADYEADGTALWAARLPTLVSSSINNLKYRQFNYPRLMEMGDSLSRWFYKRLINRYRQASRDDPYTIHFKTVKQLSALLQQQDDRGNRKKMLSALLELETAGVISSYEAIEIKSGRQIVDVKYIITPSDKFTAEQIAANKRSTDAGYKATQAGIRLG